MACFRFHVWWYDDDFTRSWLKSCVKLFQWRSDVLNVGRVHTTLLIARWWMKPLFIFLPPILLNVRSSAVHCGFVILKLGGIVHESRRSDGKKRKYIDWVFIGNPLYLKLIFFYLFLPFCPRCLLLFVIILFYFHSFSSIFLLLFNFLFLVRQYFSG